MPRIRHQGPISLALSHGFSGKDPERVVRAFAHHLYASVKQPGPPFDPMEYVAAVGLRVERAFIEANGMLVDWPGRNCKIVLRERETGDPRLGIERKENFTLAHELGHFLIRDNLIGRVPMSLFLKEHRDEERLCNMFAEELLMPSFLVYADLREKGLTPKSVLGLADTYQVSLTAMLCRIARGLKDQFFAAIWCNQGDWYDVSWATPGKFEKVVLCETGNTTVERAYKSPEQVGGFDSLLVKGKRMRWNCTSFRLTGKRVLTLGIRDGESWGWRKESMVTPRVKQARAPVQLSLPLRARTAGSAL